jgi:hypothetical protein
MPPENTAIKVTNIPTLLIAIPEPEALINRYLITSL